MNPSLIYIVHMYWKNICIFCWFSGIAPSNGLNRTNALNFVVELINNEFIKYEVGEKGPLLAITGKGMNAIENQKVVMSSAMIKTGTQMPKHTTNLIDCSLPTPDDLKELPITEKVYKVPEKDKLDEILCSDELGMWIYSNWKIQIHLNWVKTARWALAPKSTSQAF